MLMRQLPNAGYGVSIDCKCSPDGLQEIYQDRKKFSEQVFKVASSDLVNMGIGVVSYTLKDVHDDQVFSVHSK